MSVTHQTLSAAGQHTAVLTRRLAGRSREACFDAVAGCTPSERNVLAVTWELSAPEFVDRWRDHVDAAPARCGVVDVGTESTGPAANDPPAAFSRVRTVPDPADLSAVREAIDEYLSAWDVAAPTVVYLDAGGALLDGASLPAVTAFFGRLQASLTAAGVVACAAFETDGHDERTVRPVVEAFDAVLELDGAKRSAPADYPRGPSVDELFDVLSARRRRLALRHLLRAGDSHVEELAESVAGSAGTGGENRKHRERLLTGLCHVDLPKLEDAGLVTVSDEVVSATEAVTAVEPHLALTATADVR